MSTDSNFPYLGKTRAFTKIDGQEVYQTVLLKND